MEQDEENERKQAEEDWEKSLQYGSSTESTSSTEASSTESSSTETVTSAAAPGHHPLRPPRQRLDDSDTTSDKPPFPNNTRKSLNLENVDWENWGLWLAVLVLIIMHVMTCAAYINNRRMNRGVTNRFNKPLTLFCFFLLSQEGALMKEGNSTLF